MIKINNLTLKYNKLLFDNVDVEIMANCLTLIVGPSGCGKTSLLYILGLLDDFHGSTVSINNQNINELDDKQITLIRRNDISFVFQDYILIDHFTVMENIQYFASITNTKVDLALSYLKQFNLDIGLDRLLYTLSGGQKQRLAIICALIKKPKILILDEPTSALDSKNTKIIFECLNELKHDMTIIVASHNKEVETYVDEIIKIENEKIKKIKTIDNNDKTSINNLSHQKLPLTFYKKYQSKFKNKVKVDTFFLKGLMLALIVLNLVVFNLFNYLIDNTKNSISKDSLGQIYIETNKLNQEYINNKHIISYYPNHQATVTINLEQYPIMPYYKENDITSKIWAKFTTNNGVYLSYELYNQLRDIVVANSEFTCKLNINNQIIDTKLNYIGILKDGFVDGYNKNNKYFIYMNYDDYKKQTNNNPVIGYTLFVDDYDVMINIIDEMESNGNKVVYNFNQFNNLYDHINYLETMQLFATFAIALLSVILFNYVYSSYLQKRNSEIALLKSNGLLNHEITILIIQSLIKTLLLNIVIIVLLVLVSFVVELVLWKNILLIILISIYMLLINYLVIILKVKRIKPISIFRK